MRDVVQRRLEKLVHRPEGRRRRMVKEPPQVGHELLDTPALPGGRGTEAVAEVDDPEARVPRLVAKDEPEDVTHQWIGTVVLEHLEDPDRDALEEDLHADDLLAVVVGLEESVDELLEWRGVGRVLAHLLQVTAGRLPLQGLGRLPAPRADTG